MKKLLLVLFLSVGATTFANSGKVVTKKLETKKVFKVMECSISCDGVTISFQAGSAAEAVAIASRYCGGGVISING
ncbi:hypothetical protein [Flavobacterium sp.]|uniref:hypothetical protein n=1 Tax=Flavobacterium sp. TaxID=239 RepID=UPI00374DB3D2